MNVNELIKRYGKYMKTDHEHSYPLWIKYSLAICHYMIGNNKIARNYSLNLLLSKGVVATLRLKSLYIFLMSSFKLALILLNFKGRSRDTTN